jgi:hypothetical protein
MNDHRLRNLIPPLCAVLIVSGMLSGVLWSALSGGRAPRDRSERAERR